MLHKSNVKVFYGQEPPCGESITAVCVGQLSTTCSNAIKVAQWATRPQPATDNGVSDVQRFTAFTGQLSRSKCALQMKSAARSRGLQNTRPPHCMHIYAATRGILIVQNI